MSSGAPGAAVPRQNSIRFSGGMNSTFRDQRSLRLKPSNEIERSLVREHALNKDSCRTPRDTMFHLVQLGAYAARS